MTPYIEEAIINIGVRGKGKMGETDMKEKESQRCASGYSLKLSIPSSGGAISSPGQFVASSPVARRASTMYSA